MRLYCCICVRVYPQYAVRGNDTNEPASYLPLVFSRLRGLRMCDGVENTEFALSLTQLPAIRVLSQVSWVCVCVFVCTCDLRAARVCLLCAQPECVCCVCYSCVSPFTVSVCVCECGAGWRAREQLEQRGLV